MHNNLSYFFCGAGRSFGSGGDNFKWMDQWSLYTQQSAEETLFDKNSGDILGSKTVKLSQPGILVLHFEDGAAIAGGIIYWNGGKYQWIHQGE